MIIKTGVIVCHPEAAEWGVGKVIEVVSMKATIQFSDGITRKIASSHYTNLKPADPASFVQAAETTPAEKARTAPKRPKKVKEKMFYSDGTEL